MTPKAKRLGMAELRRMHEHARVIKATDEINGTDHYGPYMQELKAFADSLDIKNPYRLSRFPRVE